jgi:DNA-directed RNA polymerase subunit H (RpoH/RPB5)
MSTTTIGAKGESVRGDSAIIYDNLARLCEFRGAKVTARVAHDKFIATMEAARFVQIKAERPASDIRGPAHIVIIQFSAYRDIDGTSSKFATFLTKLLKERPSDSAEFNVILVTSAPVGATIMRIITEQSKNGIHIERYLASMFLIVVPEHICVPRHTIVSKKDIDVLYSEMHLLIGNLPCISAGGTAAAPDPMAVWLGLRPGMVVKIDRPAETAGIETVYRRCI